MVDAPEKVWADNDGGWHSNDCSEVLPCTEFVRADIAELAARRFRATEIRLERERDRERKHVGRLMREKEELRTQSDKFCDKYLAALKRAETAERQLAERDAEVARAFDEGKEAALQAFNRLLYFPSKEGVQTKHFRSKIKNPYKDRVALAGSGDGWRDMATAPKDGTRVLLGNCYSDAEFWPCVGYVMPEAAYHLDGRRFPNQGKVGSPTHWMPRPIPSTPAPPSTAGER